MDFGWHSLLPALVTIVIALSVRRISLALLAGVLAGIGVFCYHTDTSFWVKGYAYVVELVTDFERIQMALFVMMVGGMIEVLNRTGAYHAFSDRVLRVINTPRKARLTSWGFSMSLFFDDYANVLVSGASLRPVNERNGVKTVLLAYLIDIIATVASLMLLSTWAAFEMSLMGEAAKGIQADVSYSHLFIQATPYHFYTLLALLLAFLVAFTGRWFGEHFAGDESLGDVDDVVVPKVKGVKNVIVPIATLLIFAFFGIMVTGYYTCLQDDSIPLMIVNVFGEAPSVEVLLMASTLALLVALFMSRKTASPLNLIKDALIGFSGMIEIGLVILLAGALAAVSTELNTGLYIASVLNHLLSPALLPAAIYVTAVLITIATGFSWSSMAIVMPVAYAIAHALTPDYEYLLPIVSAATICGAITGAQIIPYSDKAIMTAGACRITPFLHIKTQFLQVLFVAVITIVGYLILGYIGSLLLSYGVMLLMLGAGFYVYTLTPSPNKTQSSPKRET